MRYITEKDLRQFADFRQGKVDVTPNFASMCYQNVNDGFLAISETKGVAIFPNQREGVIVIDFLVVVNGKLRLTDMRSLTADEKAMNKLKEVIESITQ